MDYLDLSISLRSNSTLKRHSSDAKYESSAFLRSNISQMIEWSHIENNVSKLHISRTQSESDLKSHTKNVIQHCLHSNQSYKNIENITKLINSTPGAKYRMPTTMHRIKQALAPLLEAEFHIWCARCKIYSSTISKTVECLSCSTNLSRAKSKYFVFLSFETQLKKVSSIILMLLFHIGIVSYNILIQ